MFSLSSLSFRLLCLSCACFLCVFTPAALVSMFVLSASSSPSFPLDPSSAINPLDYDAGDVGPNGAIPLTPNNLSSEHDIITSSSPALLDELQATSLALTEGAPTTGNEVNIEMSKGDKEGGARNSKRKVGVRIVVDDDNDFGEDDIAYDDRYDDIYDDDEYAWDDDEALHPYPLPSPPSASVSPFSSLMTTSFFSQQQQQPGQLVNERVPSSRVLRLFDGCLPHLIPHSPPIPSPFSLPPPFSSTSTVAIAASPAFFGSSSSLSSTFCSSSLLDSNLRQSSLSSLLVSLVDCGDVQTCVTVVTV